MNGGAHRPQPTLTYFLPALAHYGWIVDGARWQLRRQLTSNMKCSDERRDDTFSTLCVCWASCVGLWDGVCGGVCNGTGSPAGVVGLRDASMVSKSRCA